jgi:uncharacterized SAM-binding protein YcdF (DUF218 family)
MDTAFFLAAKLAWLLLNPETVLLALLLAGLLLRRRRPVTGRTLLAGGTAAFLLVAVYPVGQLAIAPLEKRFPPAPALARVDGIVVLGGTIPPAPSRHWGQPLLADSAERVVEALALARRHPEARIVYAGGSARLSRPDAVEADVAGDLFRAHGIDPGRLVLERESANTAENAARAKALAQPRAGQVWVLVTSAFHMPRAVGAFCAVGWPVVPYPVDFRSGPGLPAPGFDLAEHLGTLNLAVKEWGGLVAYRLAGRSARLFPAGCDPRGDGTGAPRPAAPE